MRTLKRQLDAVGVKTDQAASKAINDSMKLLVKDTGAYIAKEVPAITNAGAKRAIKVTKSTPKTLTSTATVSGNPLPLNSFKRIKVVGSTVSKTILNTRVHINRTFKSKGGKLNKHYYQRDSAKGRKVQKVYGPSLPQGVDARDILKSNGAKIPKYFSQRFKYHAARALRQLKRKGKF